MPSVYIKKYPNGRRQTVICLVCSKSFAVHNHSIASGVGKFCSRACKAASQRRQVPFTCLVCGQTVSVQPSRIRQGLKYCSWECRKVGMRGEGNPKWANDPDYRGSDWNFARLAAYRRDNFRCTECGDSEKLLAHHVVAWEISHDNSLTNLRTLCQGCHTRLHNYRRWSKDLAISPLPS